MDEEPIKQSKADAERTGAARTDALKLREVSLAVGIGMSLIAAAISVSMRYQIVHASTSGTLAYRLDGWTGAVHVVTPMAVREIKQDP